jgi:ABC-type sugar transport system permease subunit
MRGSLEPYRYVVLLLAFEIFFVAVPLGIGFYYSLHRADFFEITAFRGLDNYRAVIQSPLVRESLAATATFAFGSLFFTFAVGLSLALYLERDTRLNVFVRAVVLVPYVISMLVASLLLKWIFSRDAGVLDLGACPDSPG